MLFRRTKQKTTSKSRVQKTRVSNQSTSQLQKQIDKFLNMAKSALGDGDRYSAENYWQHAEHYQRILNDLAPAAQMPDESAQSKPKKAQESAKPKDTKCNDDAESGSEPQLAATSEPSPTAEGATTDPAAKTKVEKSEAATKAKRPRKKKVADVTATAKPKKKPTAAKTKKSPVIADAPIVDAATIVQTELATEVVEAV